MKDDKQARDAYFPLWLALMYKFKKPTYHVDPCRVDASRRQDHEDHHDDDARSEGKSSVKRQITFEKSTYTKEDQGADDDEVPSEEVSQKLMAEMSGNGMKYRKYDLAHLKLVFEFSIYTVWKSVRYGVSNGLDTAYWGFLEQRPRLISSKIFTYYISNTAYWSSLDTAYRSCFLRGLWFCNGGELPGMVRVGSMTYFQDHKWYDELADGKLKDETLALKAKVEGSWGDATPGVMKFCAWLKNSFENFHELDYDVLVKLRECWWKVNTHKIVSFTRMENFGQGPYANMKIEKTSDPYLDVNRIFRRNYEASNVGDTQENQEHKSNPNPEPSNCKIRRFEMMKYSFNDDEEYITIKESEYLNHSKDSLDAYRELLCLIDEGRVVTTPDDE
ncbi:hypothetical protein Tco_0045746 [Tanacetum coccineum]